MEIVTKGNTIEVTVNGVLQNKASGTNLTMVIYAFRVKGRIFSSEMSI